MSLARAVNPDGEARWLEKYPGLFQDIKGAGSRPRPRFDFGSGWNDIVDSLLWCIEWTLIVDLELREQPVVIRSIREHRGTLGVDFEVEAPWVRVLVRLSNLRAEATCEVCGQPGTWSNAGWPQVRCSRHRRPVRSAYVDGTLRAGVRDACCRGET